MEGYDVMMLTLFGHERDLTVTYRDLTVTWRDLA